MRAAHLPFRAILSLALGFQTIQAASSLGRSYSHGFQNGNLIRNWSFEKRGDNWHDEPMVQARFRASLASLTAVSGSYVARVQGTNSSGGAVQKLVSELFPIQENTAYVLSMEVRNASGTATIAPNIDFYEDRGGTSISPSYGGTSYSTALGWQSYAYAFTTPAKAAFARISLVNLAASQGATLYFDDVVLEKGSQVTPKADITEAISLTDDRGQVVQSQARISGSSQIPGSLKYLIQANDFDYAGRLDKSYLPYVKSGLAGFDASAATNAQAYNNGSQGATGKTSLVDRHYQDFDYWEEPGSPIQTEYMPGTAWSNRGLRRGWFFVSDLNPIDNPEEYTTSTSEAPYRLEWSKDVEGRFSLSWSNREGQIVKTATKIGGAWKATNYEYYANGALKKVLTPLDVPGNQAQQEFREVANYNSLGQVTSTYTKDRGLTKFWYNRLGQIRFSQHESQAPHDYTFTDYDGMGRPVAAGVQTLSGFTAAMADEASTASSPKTEHKGYLYDNLNAFQARTGFTLAQILPGKTIGVNGEGKLTCDFNFNKDVSLPASGAQDRFVATFYNYDQKGRVIEAYKYIGVVKTAAERVHKAVYIYDDLDRLASISLYNDASTPVRQSLKTLYYDAFGRVSKITGEGGKFISSYEFYDWGGAKKVLLGGNGDAATGLRVEFTYHGQGWLKEIKAIQQSNGHLAYQQMLGYEAKANSNSVVPGLLQAKYDGSISQQINKFTSDLDALGSVRLTNYQYDDWNRMVTADAQKNSGSPLASDQSINYAGLAWSDTEDMDSRLTYDEVGRISTNRSGVAAGDQAIYHYQPTSYRLDKVAGKLNARSGRNASASGTFTYDARGRMTEDKSKKLSIRYGWDDMPVEFTVEAKSVVLSDYNLYDAAGKRVSRVRTSTPILVPIDLDGITFFVKRKKKVGDSKESVVSSITDVAVISMGDRRWEEGYSRTGAVTQTKGVTGVFGVSGIVGDIADNGADGVYRFFVKNHQGSTMLTVDDRGRYIDGRAHDFLAYGSHKDLKVNGTDPVTQKYQGKEFEALTGLYAFGARWMDPEVGIFLSPDPAGQYFNSFAFGPGNPINGIDPSGMVWDIFRPSKWKNFFNDAGGLIYRETGEFTDKVDRWAGGFGEGDEDNILRRMYRSVTGRNSNPNCAPSDGNPEEYRCAESTRGGGPAVGVGATCDEDGNCKTTVKLGDHPEIGPGSEMVRRAEAENKAEASDITTLTIFTPSEVPAFIPQSGMGYTGTFDGWTYLDGVRMSEVGLGTELDPFTGALAGGIVAGVRWGATRSGFWTATRAQTPAQNAYRHFLDHGSEFGVKNSVDYVRQAKAFLNSPPAGTLTRVRANGDVVRYHPGTNTFGVMDKTGTPRTMFKPDPNVHGYPTNMEYYLNGY